MKQVAFGISRLLARSLAVLTISGIVMSWMPVQWVMAQATPEITQNHDVDHSLDHLWNQSLDDPTPQVRIKTPAIPVTPTLSQVQPLPTKPNLPEKPQPTHQTGSSTKTPSTPPFKAENKPKATAKTAKPVTQEPTLPAQNKQEKVVKQPPAQSKPVASKETHQPEQRQAKAPQPATTTNRLVPTDGAKALQHRPEAKPKTVESKVVPAPEAKADKPADEKAVTTMAQPAKATQASKPQDTPNQPAKTTEKAHADTKKASGQRKPKSRPEKKQKTPKPAKTKPGGLWQPIVETNPTGQPVPAMPLDLPPEAIPSELKAATASAKTSQDTKPKNVKQKVQKPTKEINKPTKQPEAEIKKEPQTNTAKQDVTRQKTEETRLPKAKAPQTQTKTVKPQTIEKQTESTSTKPAQQPAPQTAAKAVAPNAEDTTKAKAAEPDKKQVKEAQPKIKKVKQKPEKAAAKEKTAKPATINKQPANVPASGATGEQTVPKKQPEATNPTIGISAEQPQQKLPEQNKTGGTQTAKRKPEKAPKQSRKQEEKKKKPTSDKAKAIEKTEKPEFQAFTQPPESGVEATDKQNEAFPKAGNKPQKAKGAKPIKQPKQKIRTSSPAKLSNQRPTSDSEPVNPAASKEHATEEQATKAVKVSTPRQTPTKTKQPKQEKHTAVKAAPDSPAAKPTENGARQEAVKATVAPKEAPINEKSPEKQEAKQPKQQSGETKMEPAQKAPLSHQPEATPSKPAEQKTPTTLPPSKPQPAMPEGMASINRLTGEYMALLLQWRQSSKKESLEPVLNKGQEAAVAILKAADDLDEKTFDALGSQMPGYLLIRNDILVVAPNPEFFQSIAKQKGRPVDIAFFDLMKQTLNGYWPSTMEQLDHLSGCSRFGTGELVRLYGGWKSFIRQYPGAYQKALQDPNMLLLHDIEDQLRNSDAACEGPESVTKEFEQFVQTYPKSELTPQLKKRIEALKQGSADMSFKQGVKYRYSN